MGPLRHTGSVHILSLGAKMDMLWPQFPGTKKRHRLNYPAQGLAQLKLVNFSTIVETPKKIKEKRFVFPHSLRSFGPQSADSFAFALK